MNLENLKSFEELIKYICDGDKIDKEKVRSVEIGKVYKYFILRDEALNEEEKE